jgi:hypothetical protein
MPLPLAPVAVFVLRAGLAASALWAAQRLIARATRPGRTDQRAEDALDAMDDGLAAHAPADRDGQRNAAFRLQRTWRRADGSGVQIDAGVIARLRLRRLPPAGE